MKYRIYIDEVGNSDIHSSDNPNHRFLSLTGAIIDLDHVRDTVHPEMEELKHKYFKSHPDEPVIFHRKEMVNAKFPFDSLRDIKFKEQFNNDLLDALRRWQYAVISVCIDKLNHKKIYSKWRYDPYHYCLAILIERFYFFLTDNNATGDVMAESRGGKEDLRLKKSFTRLWESGTDYISSEQFQSVLTSKKLKVKPKANNISGLQLTDLIAHPSRNEILLENRLRENELPPFGKAISEILSNKYYRGRGHIFGKKML